MGPDISIAISNKSTGNFHRPVENSQNEKSKGIFARISSALSELWASLRSLSPFSKRTSLAEREIVVKICSHDLSLREKVYNFEQDSTNPRQYSYDEFESDFMKPYLEKKNWEYGNPKYELKDLLRGDFTRTIVVYIEDGDDVIKCRLQRNECGIQAEIVTYVDREATAIKKAAKEAAGGADDLVAAQDETQQTVDQAALQKTINQERNLRRFQNPGGQQRALGPEFWDIDPEYDGGKVKA